MTRKCVLVTRKQAADLLNMPTSMIRSWVHRKRLRPAGIMGDNHFANPTALYRLTDIIAVHNQRHSRRNPRIEDTPRVERPLISPDDRVCLEARRELWDRENRQWPKWSAG